MNLLYALLMTITVNGQTAEFVIDKNMTLSACRAASTARGLRADTLRHRTATIKRAFECKAMRKGERF